MNEKKNNCKDILVCSLVGIIVALIVGFCLRPLTPHAEERTEIESTLSTDDTTEQTVEETTVDIATNTDSEIVTVSERLESIDETLAFIACLIAFIWFYDRFNAIATRLGGGKKI